MIDTLKPGIHYGISEAVYHADPCERPSLSSGIARDLIMASPLHAWHHHPRLNPQHVPEEAEKFDLGRAAHALILEGVRAFEIIVADDWRTKAAKEARDLAYANGKIPLLSGKWNDVQAMAEAVRRQCDQHEGLWTPLREGAAEVTLVWEEPGGILCRARPDWIHEGNEVIDDLKTTAGSANPDAWTRTLYGMGSDVQAAFYLRGHKALTGEDAQFRFVVAESEPPFALCVMDLSPAALALANRKVVAAIGLWRECLESGNWPGYPQQTCTLDAPPWVEAQWMERELRDSARGPLIETPDLYTRAG